MSRVIEPLFTVLVSGSPTDERIPISADVGVPDNARSAAERGAGPPNIASNTESCPESCARGATVAVGSSAKSGGTTKGAARPICGAAAASLPRISQFHRSCPALSIEAQPDSKITVEKHEAKSNFCFICEVLTRAIMAGERV